MKTMSKQEFAEFIGGLAVKQYPYRTELSVKCLFVNEDYGDPTHTRFATYAITVLHTPQNLPDESWGSRRFEDEFTVRVPESEFAEVRS